MDNRFRRALARYSIWVAFGGLLVMPAAALAAFGDRPLRTGTSGHDVRVLQSWLDKLGFSTSVDGAFGRNTRWNLRRWEQKEQIKIDGRLSVTDARLMRSRMDSQYPASSTNGTDGTDGTNQTTGTTETAPGSKATIGADGRALAPAGAPPEVQAAIAAANEIVGKPYKYGGGHGRWEDSGYDCSGTVSYALRGAGLLDRPMNSSELAGWGRSGKGQWLTVYGNSGHAYAIIAGLRLDTSGSGGKGPRWHEDLRSPNGYAVRRWAGL
jgi:peptidoglycan hydrolase-like protein with peptidoglycan-binding domain